MLWLDVWLTVWLDHDCGATHLARQFDVMLHDKASQQGKISLSLVKQQEFQGPARNPKSSNRQDSLESSSSAKRS